ncbi:MAG: DUF1735 and LamG domain-containing protein [Bacteroidales bacterium]|nr:DUF1735 and LamG domain-containing protein [Bacteroidales bacterium]MDE6870882.1 DUF1735 and LamG domain-containing protein [Bacteroidales bacterium]
MRKSIIKSIAACALAFLAAGCEDAKYEVLENLVYISDAYNAKTKDITMLEGTTRTSIIVRMAQATDKDVTVSLKMDEAYLDEYNAINQTDFKVVPDAIFDRTVSIPAGDVSSEPVVVEIPYFETNGASYVLPISIEDVQGDVEKAASSSRLIINLVKPIHQFVPKFTWYNGMKAAPEDTDWGLSLTNYTLEWWSRVTGKNGDSSGYSKNNQAIFDSGSSSTELYIRFGDLVYASGGVYYNNFLQIKTMGDMQIDTGDPTSEGNGLTSGVWYHFAVTYDSATGKCTMYKNGIESGLATGAAGRPMLIDKFSMISSGSQYFPDFCELCQVRLWKTTRTASQLQKGMYSEVAYDNPDLILYLPMSETARIISYTDNTQSAEIDPAKTISSIVLKDVTGNGHDVTVGNMGLSSTSGSSVTWAEYTFSK